MCKIEVDKQVRLNLVGFPRNPSLLMYCLLSPKKISVVLYPRRRGVFHLVLMRLLVESFGDKNAVLVSGCSASKGPQWELL